MPYIPTLAVRNQSEAALRLAGFDRFDLDQLVVDDMEPAGSRLERLLGVLDRPAKLFRCCALDVYHREGLNRLLAPHAGMLEATRPDRLVAQKRSRN